MRRTDFVEFAESLRAMRIVARRRTRLVAGAVVGAEATAVVLLAVPRTGATAYAFALALLVGFTVAVVVVLVRHERVSCRCFGASARPVGGLHIARNSFLLALCVAGLAASRTVGSWHPGGVALAVCGGLVAALFVVRSEDLGAVIVSTPKPGGPASVPSRR
nr:MauE/DoxX family redox-associated membrane protein [Virgisporangium aurantiacum]